MSKIKLSSSNYQISLLRGNSVLKKQRRRVELAKVKVMINLWPKYNGYLTKGYISFSLLLSEQHQGRMRSIATQVKIKRLQNAGKSVSKIKVKAKKNLFHTMCRYIRWTMMN